MNPPVAPSRHRHAMAWAMLIFCAVLLSYLTFWAPSDPLREQLSLGLLALMGSTFGTYAFGVSWDFRSNRNRKPDPENP